jgi:DNA-binding response OmpR family regulator
MSPFGGKLATQAFIFFFRGILMTKILIVDDDVTITELMKALMMMEGHQPTTVNDSMKAIEVATEVDPDLIILDLMMPGLSGFELCEMMHQDPRFANIPTLVVSARDDPESKAKALRAGARDYLIKPFGVDDLIRKVKELTGS